ncbi:MAG: PAS domain S-box protein [Methanoregulaceae archaeon]|nr:PAS domain S-box protein [Methanoregulaceae archaeon]
MKETDRNPGNGEAGSGQEDAGNPAITAQKGPTPGERSGLEEEIEALRKEVSDLRQREADRTLIEESLKESEEKFRNLIQSTDDGIILNDDRGVILEWNIGMEKIFGIPGDEAIGRTLLEIASRCSPENEDAGSVETWLSSIIKELDNKDTSSKNPTIEVSIRIPDGRIRVIEAKNFCFTSHGQVFYGGIVRDITERKQSDKALIEHEEELRNLIESSGDGIIITDEEGRITKWNKAEELLTGLAAKDVLGLPAWEIQASRSPDEMHKPDPITWFRDTWDILLHDETHPFFRGVIDDQLINGNGDVRDVQVRAFRIPTRKGFRIGAIVRDITEQKQMEKAILESEEKYRSLVEMSPDIIVIHQGGKIVFVNPAIKKLLRTTTKPEDLIGMDIYDLIHPDFHSMVKQGTQNDLDGLPPATMEIQVVRGDNTLVTLEGRGTRILYNKKPAVQVVIRDITERKSAEMQLKEYTGSLKRSNEDLELFAYIATHDLQEPIRGIVAYSQLLLAECSAEHSSQTKKYLENIARDGLRLNSLMSDIREYLKVRSGAKPFAPTDMEEIFSNILKTLHRGVRETRASITHDPLPVVYADSAQITQVLLNLLSNAIKFHKKEVRPEIHVSACLHDGIWQFAVSDNGIGIPKEYHTKVFVLFERLHQRDTYPGTGLGLALCRRIIERHGGRMWVESETGNGSTFYFTLPVDPHEVVV